MKVLIFAIDGFIGRNVAQAFNAHDVFGTSRKLKSDNILNVDLTDKASILKAIDEIKPDVIINCAGVISDSEKFDNNVTFTKNIIEAVAETKLKAKIIICGSAAVYGNVDPNNLPVNEDAPLNANAGYGLSKLNEEKTALKLSQTHNLPVVVARLFNVVGIGMNPKLLLPNVIGQILHARDPADIKVEVSRLDSGRDYIDVSDVAKAFKIFAENDTEFKIYNLGTGKTTTNGQLIELVQDYIKSDNKPKIIESSDQPEPLLAIQADIGRIRSEFSWTPAVSLADSVKEIVDAAR